MSERSKRRHWGGGAVAMVVLVCSGGCGDDDPSASEQVCDARTELGTAVDDVVADVQAANLGDARDGAADVVAAWDELVSAVGELAQEQREALAPDVESLAADFEALRQAQGIDEIRTSLAAIGSGVEGIVTEITDTMRCD